MHVGLKDWDNARVPIWNRLSVCIIIVKDPEISVQ